MYLQQQKLVWSVRLYKKVGSAEHIYNSRNQCGLLDLSRWCSRSFGIYNSRNQCGLLDRCGSGRIYSRIYNSRNQCGLLDTYRAPLRSSYLQQQKLVWSVRLTEAKKQELEASTIVEISVVCQTSMCHGRQGWCIYNSRNQCGLLDVLRRESSYYLSTIVEISVVCQTISCHLALRFIYNSRNQCGLLDNLHRHVEVSYIYNSRNQCGLLDTQRRLLISLKSTIVEISVVCQTKERNRKTAHHLQQQKLVWSVRPFPSSSSTELNLQQQKLVWSVRQA